MGMGREIDGAALTAVTGPSVAPFNAIRFDSTRLDAIRSPPTPPHRQQRSRTRQTLTRVDQRTSASASHLSCRRPILFRRPFHPQRSAAAAPRTVQVAAREYRTLRASAPTPEQWRWRAATVPFERFDHSTSADRRSLVARRPVSALSARRTDSDRPPPNAAHDVHFNSLAA